MTPPFPRLPTPSAAWSGFAVLALALACGPSEPPRPEVTGPHLIFVSLDTLRADHLSCYGYERETSPHLDELAKESVLFENAMATSSSTAPSHMTMFSGVLPRVHGIFNGRPAQLAPDVPYVPSMLRDLGYRTAAFADGGIVTAPFGFADGYDVFDSAYEPFDEKLDRVEAWLDDAPDDPTFLFVHTYGVHAPYLPDPEHDLFTDPDYDGRLKGLVRALRGRRDRGQMDGLDEMREAFFAKSYDFESGDVQHLIDLYDGCIHGVDAGVGRLLAMLEAKGWLEDAWLIVTSDHGEAFGEHGSFSHRRLHREELWVPLLIRPPGGSEARRVATRVSQLDMAPTLLEMLGRPVPEVMQGESLLPFEGLTDDRRAVASGGSLKQDAVMEGPLKLIERISKSVTYYHQYDLAADPAESHDLVAAGESRKLRSLKMLIKRMRNECGSLQKQLGEPAIGVLDPEHEAELRALGYLKD